MKAKLLAAKLTEITEQPGFSEITDRHVFTIELLGGTYTFEKHAIPELIKKLARIDESKPDTRTYLTGVNIRFKEMQTIYAHLLTLPIEMLKKEIKRPTGCGLSICSTLEKHYKDFILDILRKKQPTIDQKPITMKTEKQNNGLRLVKYSEKAYAIFGDTKPLKEKLKEIGGKFNPYLKENGEKSPGWIFSAKKLDQLKELVN